MRQEIFNVDDIINNYNTINSHNLENKHTICRRLTSKILQISNINKSKSISTNGNIGSFLQDDYMMSSITLKQITLLNIDNYYIGKLSNIDVYINTHLRWDDSRIIFNKDLKFKRYNKLSKILDREYIDFIDELIIIDTHNILI